MTERPVAASDRGELHHVRVRRRNRVAAARAGNWRPEPLGDGVSDPHAVASLEEVLTGT